MVSKKTTTDVPAAKRASASPSVRQRSARGTGRPAQDLTGVAEVADVERADAEAGEGATTWPAFAATQPGRGEISRPAEEPDAEASTGETPRVGDAIGENSRFVITRTLGTGGMGLVCGAYDQQLDRSVAVKFVHRDHQLPWRQLTALLRQEAKATAKLSHENIVAIFDIGTWGNVPFLVMEHLEGEPLQRLMSRELVPAERAIEIMIDVLAGLDHAHRSKVIHRDLKPANVFIVHGGRAKILDFGLARIEQAVGATAEAKAGEALSDRTALELSSAGTPPYMAPEQWRSWGQDARTDIWAAGVVFYEMLTGELPQGATNVAALRAWSLSRLAAPSILLRRPTLPESIDRIVARALRKDRRQRFQSAAEFLQALRDSLAELRGGAPVRGGGKRAPERRQATLLAAAPVAAPSDDPDDELDTLAPFQQAVSAAVTAQGGKIFAASDSVLAGFGYPIADEHDALRAVRAGLGIVDALRERGLGARIAIHTGVVVVEELAGSQGIAVRGGAPRAAAALAARADVGEVWLSGTTHKLVRKLVQAEPQAIDHVDGIADKFAYRVVGEDGARSRFDSQFSTKQTRLVGRASKIRQISQLWEQAKDGKGQVARISGEAGIGKSRLVQELRGRVEHEGHTRLTCQAWPHFRDSALRPIIDLLLRSMYIQREDAPAVRLAKIERGLAPLGLPLPETVPVFAALLSIPLAEPYAPLELTPQALKHRTLTALVEMLIAMTKHKPVLFVVEDLHWVDHSTVEMIQLLLDAVPTARLLVLLTARPEFRPPWPERPYSHHVPLKRLSAPQTAAMIRAVAGHRALPAELSEQLAARTDGIPLFVEEMTSMITDAIDADGAAPPASAIPTTLSEMLLARLDRLPSTGMEVARIGAVIGRTFSYGMIARAADMPRPTLDQGLTLLVDAGMLVARGRPPDSKYLFKHALIQDSAYQSLVQKRRAALHGRLAEILVSDFPELAELEPELLAHHHTEAGHAEIAFGLWKTAGSRAAERSAHVEAIGHFQHALQSTKSFAAGAIQQERELAILLALGSQLMATRGYAHPEVEKNYARAYELCQLGGASSGDMFPAVQGLWQYYMVGGNIPKALALSEQLVTLARAADNRTFELLALRARGTTTMLDGDQAAARDFLLAGLKLYDFDSHKGLAMRYSHDPGVAHGVYLAWTQWLLGYPDRALAAGREALELAKRLAHPLTVAFASCYLGMVHCYRGEYAVAKRVADRAIRLSTDHKLALWLAFANMVSGWALSGLGDHEAGITQLREGMAGWRSSGARAGMTFFPVTCAECCRRAGWLDQAAALVAEAAEIVSVNGEHYYEAELFRVGGDLAAAAGDAATAERQFRAGMALAAKQGAKPFELRNAISLASLLAGRGPDAADEGRRLVESVHSWFTEGHGTEDLTAAKKLLGRR